MAEINLHSGTVQQGSTPHLYTYATLTRWAHCPRYNGKTSKRIGAGIVTVAAVSVLSGFLGILGQINLDPSERNWIEFMGTAMWCGGMVGLIRG